MPQFHPPISIEDVRRCLKLAEACPYRTKEPGCCTGYRAWCNRAVAGRVDQFTCIECQRDTVARPAEIRPHPPTLPANIPDRPDPKSGVRLGGCCGG